MKKVKILLMALLLTLSLAACGEEQKPEPTPQPDIPEVTVTVSKIEVKALNSEYKVNDKFPTDGKLTVTMSDNTTKEVTITEAMVKGFDTTTAGEKNLTITYEGKTVNYKINVAKVGPNLDEFKIADSYYHEFKKGEITAAGGNLENNGLTWNYTASTYVGWDTAKGVQLGSSKRPITTPVTFTATFPADVIVTDFAIELSVAANGNSQMTLTLGENITTNTIDNKDPQAYEKFELNALTNTFVLELKAEAKAIYLKSIGFSILKKDESFDLSSDSTEQEKLEPVKPGVTPNVPATKFAPISIEEYYKNTDLTKTQDALKAELNTLVSQMTAQTYGDARYMLVYADEDVKNPGYLNDIYLDSKFKAAWDGTILSREHVWACDLMRNSLGADYRPINETADHRSDLHNLRLSERNINSSRGNKMFGEEGMEGCFYPNHANGKDERGDVARIIFYMYVRYDFLTLGEVPGDNQMGKLSVLLKWAKEDKVDDFEKQRNNRIYEYQGNRNPFIDHPELIDQLFT